MAAPAAEASTSLIAAVPVTGSGGVRSNGPGSSPRITCLTSRGRMTVSSPT